MKLTAVLLLIALALALPLLAADVSGKWTATFEGQNGQMTIVYNFKVDGTKLTGTVTGPMGDIEISEGKVDGDNITFTVSTDQFTVVHKGTVSGDEMKLKADVGDRTMELTAKRVKP